MQLHAFVVLFAPRRPARQRNRSSRSPRAILPQERAEDVPLFPLSTTAVPQASDAAAGDAILNILVVRAAIHTALAGVSFGSSRGKLRAAFTRAAQSLSIIRPLDSYF